MVSLGARRNALEMSASPSGRVHQPQEMKELIDPMCLCVLRDKSELNLVGEKDTIFFLSAIEFHCG